MRYCSIDIETCGLDWKNCDIIEFGAVLDDLNNQRPIKMLPQFHCYFCQQSYQGEPYALSMHSTIFRRIAEREKGYTYCDPTKLGMLFKRFLMNNGYESEHDVVTITAAGKNFGSFDLQFLNEKTDLSKHVNIRHRIIDPSILFVSREDISLPNMAECKKRAGMSEYIAHDAIADALDVVGLVRHGLANKFYA